MNKRLLTVACPYCRHEWTVDLEKYSDKRMSLKSIQETNEENTRIPRIPSILSCPNCGKDVKIKIRLDE